MRRTIDLNCDMGELKAGQENNFDKEIMPFVTSCNISCGFHSGNPLTIENAIKLAISHGVKVGAHPSYNDHKSFGRKSVKIDLSTLIEELYFQLNMIKDIVEGFEHQLHHVKPHGALYNDIASDSYLADAFVRLVKSINPSLKIFILAHSQAIDVCKKHRVRCVSEGFSDRCYQEVNQLRSRSLEGSVIHKPEQVLAQVASLLNGKIILHDSRICNITIESICLHSDTRDAVSLSQKIYRYLKEKNVHISAVA